MRNFILILFLFVSVSIQAQNGVSTQSSKVTTSGGKVLKIVNASVIPQPPSTNMLLWIESDYGITLNGSDVSGWLDKSVNANNLSQANAAAQPPFIADGGSSINNKPVLDFDGTSFMDLTTPLSTVRTFFIVYKYDGLTGLPGWVLNGNSTYDFYSDGAVTLYTSGFLSAFISGGNNYVNGVLTTTNTILKPTDYTIISGTTTGNVNIDNLNNDRGGMYSPLYGKVAAVILYSDVKSAGDLTIIENYLENKYAIP